MGLNTRPTDELLKRLVFLANTRGIIPNPLTATRVYVGDVASGEATTVIYTVPAGKTLFINSAHLSSRASGAGNINCKLAVRDDDDTFYCDILNHYYDAIGQQVSPLSFLPALEFPASYDVYVQSYSAVFQAQGLIFGWLEDA